MSSFPKYFSSPGGFVKSSFALLLFTLLPVLIGTYITKGLVRSCPGEKVQDFDKRFEGIKVLLIMFAFIFQITLLILLYKMFDFAKLIMDPIFAIPKRGPKEDKIPTWIFIFFVFSIVLSLIYGLSLGLTRLMVDPKTVVDLDTVYKKHEVFLGGVVVVMVCFLIFFGILAKVSTSRD
jgi:hypothetical protein